MLAAKTQLSDPQQQYVRLSCGLFATAIFVIAWFQIWSVFMLYAEVKVSRNGPERRSGKRIVAGTAFRLEFQIH